MHSVVRFLSPVPKVLRGENFVNVSPWLPAVWPQGFGELFLQAHNTFSSIMRAYRNWAHACCSSSRERLPEYTGRHGGALLIIIGGTVTIMSGGRQSLFRIRDIRLQLVAICFGSGACS